MVYVPVGPDRAALLRSGGELGPVPGCAPTGGLIAALGSDTSSEEADFAALSNAGVLALVTGSSRQRVVLAADVDARQIVDRRTVTGEVEVTGLRWAQVQSLFGDEPGAAEQVATAHEAARHGGLADALAAPAVEDLIHRHDLLWFSTDELDQIG